MKSHQIAREHLGTVADRRKQEYDLNVKPRSFQVGEKVWYLYPRRYTAKSPKWQKHYIGPYEVVKALPPADYVIRKSKRSEPMVVHADKLKICCSRRTFPDLRLIHGRRVTTLWVRRPLRVNQLGQLSLPSLRGR